MQEITSEEEKSQFILKHQEVPIENTLTPQTMGPPIITKVPKSCKVWTYTEKANSHKCNVCNRTFSMNQQLKHHIRRLHFNLKAKTPYYELKSINQVWFEKVLNSKDLIEIKKTGNNTLVMKKIDANVAVQVDEKDDIIDLTYLYPTSSKSKNIQCDICKIAVLKENYKDHYEEQHRKIKNFNKIT